MAKDCGEVNIEISVPMQVHWWRTVAEGKLIEVHGCVGDYEVLVWLDKDDPQAKKIMEG